MKQKQVVEVNGLLEKLRDDEAFKKIESFLREDKSSDYYKYTLLNALKRVYTESTGSVYYKINKKGKSIVLFIVEIIENNYGDLFFVVYPYCNRRFGITNMAYPLYMSMYKTIFRCCKESIIIPITFIWNTKSRFQKKLSGYFNMIYEEVSEGDSHVKLSTYQSLLCREPFTIVDDRIQRDGFDTLVDIGQKELSTLKDSSGIWAYQVNGKFIKESRLSRRKGKLC